MGSQEFCVWDSLFHSFSAFESWEKTLCGLQVNMAGREDVSDAPTGRVSIHSGKAWGMGNGRGVWKLHQHHIPTCSNLPQKHMFLLKGLCRGLNVALYKKEDTV